MSATSTRTHEEFESAFRSNELARNYETGNITTDEFYDYLRVNGGLQMTREKFLEAWCSIFAPDLKISRALIESLHRRYPLILVSNTNEAHVQFLAKQYRLFEYFTHTVFSNEVHSMKPDRKIFDHAIALSGKPPSQLFFIDDRPENVEGARQLGMQTHLFTNEVELIPALRAAGIEL